MSAPTLRTEIEQWPLARPFRIAGHTFSVIDVLLVTLEKAGHVGRGEAAGVYYRSDYATSMIKRVEALRTSIEAGISRDALQRMLPPAVRAMRWTAHCGIWKRGLPGGLPGS